MAQRYITCDVSLCYRVSSMWFSLWFRWRALFSFSFLAEKWTRWRLRWRCASAVAETWAPKANKRGPWCGRERCREVGGVWFWSIFGVNSWILVVHFVLQTSKFWDLIPYLWGGKQRPRRSLRGRENKNQQNKSLETRCHSKSLKRTKHHIDLDMSKVLKKRAAFKKCSKK